MSNKSKKFYSSLDTGFTTQVPQAIQHIVVAKAAEEAGGVVVFYTMEDHYTLKSHEVILGRINDKPDISGIIFFRVAQFLYSGKFDFATLSKVLERGLEVHFAREKLSLHNQAELDEAFPFFYTLQETQSRNRAFFNSMLKDYSEL